MRTTLAAAVVAFACQSAFAVETFEEAWQTRWRPQVTGSLLSRRLESQIKASAKEVWDVAQANVPTPAGPLIAANKATVKIEAKPAPRRQPRRRWRLFR